MFDEIPELPELPELPDNSYSVDDELFERIRALEQRLQVLEKRFKQVEVELIDQGIIIPF